MSISGFFPQTPSISKEQQKLNDGFLQVVQANEILKVQSYLEVGADINAVNKVG